VPEEGSFIAWKKANGLVLKLEIPAEAKRTSCLINRKCRAEFVKTLEIIGSDKNEVCGSYDDKTIYKIGEITRADSFDDDIRIDCSHGIHFFITRKEAEKWI
jgi:hypothetical protein